jgi:hypothetical protein
VVSLELAQKVAPHLVQVELVRLADAVVIGHVVSLKAPPS